MTETQQTIIRLATVLLQAQLQAGGLIAEDQITKAVDQCCAILDAGMSPELRAEAAAELYRRYNVWTGTAGILVANDPTHQDWLPGRRGNIEWRFWSRYRAYMEGKLPPHVLVELDESTDRILGLLEDPQRAGVWRRQGLVVGHVQSGKTGNYTGLICKAADAGFKVIVVLSGIHNSLRAQTQVRLDEGFLGKAAVLGESETIKRLIGVGLIDGSVVADSVTTRDERGDFSKAKAKGFSIHAGGNVLLFVVKKNARVLQNLLDWAQLSASKPTANARKVVPDVPVLVIDDEADQASVDTGGVPVDEQTGEPDHDHDPKPINRLIRQFLETFERRAYVGYTATPFANVFIHPDAFVPECGEDLFPRHFIINLSAPSDYFGPDRVFGRGDENAPKQGSTPSRIRFIKDADSWVPPSHKSTHLPLIQGKVGIPDSLHLAIRSFILSCAGRRARDQVVDHKSMLVHVTRFTAVQERVHAEVVKVVEDLRTRWRARDVTRGDDISAEMESLWSTDFVSTSKRHGEVPIEWDLVKPHVAAVLDVTKVNLINAKASDALIYEQYKDTGLHVIAVGGDKLSRGLTLEGLSVSYFLRSSRMYDTLMQMGRWFGYRHGYEDLCRLYLSEELAEWYGHITEAADELRREFESMVLRGGTPDDYGLRVRSHPVLAITGKLRPGTPTLTTSLSATPFEPTVLNSEPVALERNWEITEEFLRRLGPVHENGVHPVENDGVRKRGTWPGGLLWRGVSGSEVLRFLSGFSFADKDLTRTPSTAVTAYISDRLAAGELKEWTVLVNAAESPEANDKVRRLSFRIGDKSRYTIIRRRTDETDLASDRYRVKRLGSPKDEGVDLSADEWEKAVAEMASLKADPNASNEVREGLRIRHNRPAGRGLMILHMLTPTNCLRADKLDQRVPLVAPYISFPHSPGATPVQYKLSYRYWEDELRGVE
jgi:hypothetical protein